MKRTGAAIRQTAPVNTLFAKRSVKLSLLSRNIEFGPSLLGYTQYSGLFESPP